MCVRVCGVGRGARTFFSWGPPWFSGLYPFHRPVFTKLIGVFFFKKSITLQCWEQRGKFHANKNVAVGKGTHTKNVPFP